MKSAEVFSIPAATANGYCTTTIASRTPKPRAIQCDVRMHTARMLRAEDR